MPEDVLSNLTEQQREAVTHKDGPMLVVAGAGSGKTRVVTRRIAWLLQNGVWPQQILAMTFTNKAAREMRERVEALTGQAPQNIGTFHSCCARFLRRDITKLGLGFTQDFTIYDEADKEAVLKQCLAALPDPAREFLKPRGLIATISRLKNSRCALPDAMPDAQAQDKEALHWTEQAVREYNKRMILNNALDFDDLLLYMFRLLDERPELRDIYHSRFRYLLVDEYQDTNHLQYELIMRLTNESHNVHVTGDPDQSIYSWRGADYSNIMSFTRDFPEAKVVKLERNYRSSQIILDTANAVIAHNADRIPKNLYTEANGGNPVWLTCAYNETNEAEMVARRLVKLHGSRAAGHARWRDFAVLYRTNAQSRPIEEFFVRVGIPYQIFGGLRFYDRKEVKDILAPMRLRANPADAIAFKRLVGAFPCGKGLGEKAVRDLCEAAAQENLPVMDYLLSDAFSQKWCRGRTRRAAALSNLAAWWRTLCAIPVSPASLAVQGLIRLSGYSETLEKLERTQRTSAKENLESLQAKADEFTHGNPEATLEDFLQEVSLVADTDNHDETQDCVLLMTLHSAKGLEFRDVFIVGLEDGLLPHRNAIGDHDAYGQAETPQLQEERRLFYVGLTRAKRAVYLSYTRVRYGFGGSATAIPSRFIDELPRNLVKSFQYFNGHEVQSALP